QRCNRDGKLRPERRPRGLVLSTGEEIPNGKSLRARVLLQEVVEGDIQVASLTKCQRDAAEGLYAAAMAGYRRWLAGRYGEVRASLKRQHEQVRDQARAALPKDHARSPGIVADLALGLKYFLDFAVEAGAVTAAERADLSRRFWAALCGAAHAQAQDVD